MPLYEYQCFVCDHRFERLQKVSADVLKDCPSCGGRVRRLLGVPALQFKGSGWYVTDYGKGNGGGSATSETASSESAKTDTKSSTSTSTSSPPEKKAATSTSD